MTKRILVTGAAGFIGSHFVAHVLETTNHHVVALDGLSYAGNFSRLTELNCFDPDRCVLFRYDLKQPLEWVKEGIGKVDWVVNFASESHVDRSIEDPVPFVRNNVELMLTMLEFARGEGVEKFVQIGTDEVYGDVPRGSSCEWDMIRPSNPYSSSKAMQDSLCHGYWRTYALPLILTNCTNNFGERQHPEKFVPLVIRNLLRDEVTRVHGARINGEWHSGSRCWLHARNHADAVLWLLENHEPQKHPEHTLPSRFNIPGDREISNLEVVDLVAGILDKEPRIEFLDFHSSRPGHDLRYALDGSKLHEAGWRAPLETMEAFRRTVEFTVANAERWL